MKFSPRNDAQVDYVRSISENTLTICIGPAGTGKSSVSAALAAEYFCSSKVKKIIIARPMVEAGKSMGFLPGSFVEKISPYMVPIIEEMEKHMGKEEVRKAREEGFVEVLPLEFARGRNFHDSFVLLDEAQNATFTQLKMFMTRLGKNSKMVINGDVDQVDLRKDESGGLDYICCRLKDLTDVGICKMTSRDIVRSRIIGSIIKRVSVDDFQDFKRELLDQPRQEDGAIYFP